MTFLEHEIDEFNAGHDWFLLFAEKDTVLNHARTKKDPAKDASEIEKYCGNLDYLAVSKLFGVNIAVMNHEMHYIIIHHGKFITLLALMAVLASYLTPILIYIISLCIYIYNN